MGYACRSKYFIWIFIFLKREKKFSLALNNLQHLTAASSWENLKVVLLLQSSLINEEQILHNVEI